MKEQMLLKECGQLYRIKHTRRQKAIAKHAGIDIYKSALRRLEGDGFDIEEPGSKYIARLIEALYHERELLEKYGKRDSYKGYWDLKDINNPHYEGLGDAKEIQKEMRESIIHSPYEDNDADINELIYDLADLEIKHYDYYRSDKPDHKIDNAISYKKNLIK